MTSQQLSVVSLFIDTVLDCNYHETESRIVATWKKKGNHPVYDALIEQLRKTVVEYGGAMIIRHMEDDEYEIVIDKVALVA